MWIDSFHGFHSFIHLIDSFIHSLLRLIDGSSHASVALTIRFARPYDNFVHRFVHLYEYLMVGLELPRYCA